MDAPLCLVRHRDVIRAVEIHSVGAHDDAEAIEIEMCVARLHRVPRPLDKVSAFRERTRTLRPLQLCADTFVLITPGDSHHVRITDNLALTAHDGCRQELSEQS